jgi:hypothetical protein
MNMGDGPIPLALVFPDDVLNLICLHGFILKILLNAA